jgi:hypothetical protein
VTRLSVPVLCVVLSGISAPTAAHDGPAFPIFADESISGLRLSLWIDPDVDALHASGRLWAMTSKLDGTVLDHYPKIQVVVRGPIPTNNSSIQKIILVNGATGTASGAVTLKRPGRYSIAVTVVGSKTIGLESVFETTPQRPLTSALTLFVIAGAVIIIVGRGVRRGPRA